MNYIECFDLTLGKKIIEENFTNWTSGNEKIDKFIQEKQSKYKHTAVFEWIPFNNFIDIKEIEDNCLTAATWKEGTLNYSGKWIRQSYEKVCLIYLYDSQNITDEFINKVNKIFYEFSLSISMYVNFFFLIG
jgi:hypothetical protein